MGFLSPLLNPRLLSLLAVAIGAGVLTSPLQSLLPVYVESALRRAPWFTAQLRSVLLLLAGATAPLAGVLCDSVGRKRTYVLGLTGIVAAGAVFLTPSWMALAGLLAYAGLMSGLTQAAGQTYLIHAVDRRFLGVATAGYFLGHTVGNSLGGALGGHLAEAVGFGALGRVMSGGAVALVLLALFMPEAGPPPRSSTRMRESLADYAHIIRRPEVRLLLGVRFLPTFFWGSTTLVLPLLLFRATGSAAVVGNYTAVSLLFAAACQLLTGWLSDRWGKRAPVMAAVVLETALAGVLAWTAKSFVWLFASGVAVTAAAWSLSTNIPGLVNDVAGPEEKGRVLAVTHVVWCAGMLFGSQVGGGLVNVHPGLPFLVTGLACSGAIACAWRLLESLTAADELPVSAADARGSAR